jgi:excisionase family DNA binding protein
MENYMTAKEVAVKVRLSEQTIRRYTMLKQIPFHKIGRTVRYKECEIEQWVEKSANLEAGLFVEDWTGDQTGGES